MNDNCNCWVDFKVTMSDIISCGFDMVGGGKPRIFESAYMIIKEDVMYYYWELLEATEPILSRSHSCWKAWNGTFPKSNIERAKWAELDMEIKMNKWALNAKRRFISQEATYTHQPIWKYHFEIDDYSIWIIKTAHHANDKTRHIAEYVNIFKDYEYMDRNIYLIYPTKNDVFYNEWRLYVPKILQEMLLEILIDTIQEMSPSILRIIAEYFP